MTYENKNVTFHFVTVEVQKIFSNLNYDFFFIISDITEFNSSVIIEKSFSITTITVFIQSVSVESTLMNFFHVANSFLKKESDFNKKIHVEKSLFFNYLILISNIHPSNLSNFRFYLFRISYIYHKI